jgi:hypothetical protein
MMLEEDAAWRGRGKVKTLTLDYILHNATAGPNSPWIEEDGSGLLFFFAHFDIWSPREVTAALGEI